jgi:hypothetical protein
VQEKSQKSYQVNNVLHDVAYKLHVIYAQVLITFVPPPFERIYLWCQSYKNLWLQSDFRIEIFQCKFMHDKLHILFHVHIYVNRSYPLHMAHAGDMQISLEFTLELCLSFVCMYALWFKYGHQYHRNWLCSVKISMNINLWVHIFQSHSLTLSTQLVI